jgi:alkylation response protein AidB-like acyl-CoA dehydrogenase
MSVGLAVRENPTDVTRTTDDDLAAIRDAAARALSASDAANTLRGLLDEQGRFDRGLWQTAADLGWFGIGIAEEVAGFGLDLSARCVIAEEIGRALGAIPFAVHNAALAALARSGDETIRALIESGIAGETVFAVAHAEAPPGTTPPYYADGRVNGALAAVQAAAFADYLILPGTDGRLVLVALAQPGIARTMIDSLDNSRGHADVVFDAATAMVVGDTAAGRLLLDEVALMTAFEQVGGAAACLALTREFALQRRAFGQPIAAFQTIKHALADFYVLGQIARGAALAALEVPLERFSYAVACARLAATRAYEQCTQDSIQLHGGIGGTWEAVPHLHLRRSRCLALEWGGIGKWRDRILASVVAARAVPSGASHEDVEIAAYRSTARAFLAEHAPRYSGTARMGLTRDEDLALARAWQRLKADHGFAAITMPAAYGGGGGSALHKVVFGQEEAKYDLPTGYFSISMGMPIPIMAAYATEAQKQALLPPAIRGETIWSQLFSEPAAGSDLAALRMTARRDGDDWILNGQKLWTSWAHISDWGILVARHDPDVPKHQGLTYFFVDLKAPGVSVRPVRMLGPSHVNEVFFDEVVVPDSQRLGAVGQGFKVALHTLMIERYAVTDPWGYGPDPITLLAEDSGVDRDDPDLRDAAAQAFYEAQALGEINRRAFLALASGGEPGPDGSITKLVVMATRQRLARAAMDAAGPASLGRFAGAGPRDDFTESWLLAPLSRIAGGTDQILRNTIAERILGLPQDHRPDKGVAFKDIAQ